MLDTTHAIETPEGVELQLHLAGPVVRALAWSIDMLIRIGIYIGLSIVLSMLGGLGTGLILISIFLLEWFYPVLFEVYRQGATPGKKQMGIKVLHESGTPISWSASMIRNLLRAVDFLPALYGFGLVSMLLNREFKRLGDLAAGTVVVYVETTHTQLQVPAARASKLTTPLTLAEQRAIVSFAERAQIFSEARAKELAHIAHPLIHFHPQATNVQDIQYLYEIANGLVGQHDETTSI